MTLFFLSELAGYIAITPSSSNPKIFCSSLYRKIYNIIEITIDIQICLKTLMLLRHFLKLLITSRWGLESERICIFPLVGICKKSRMITILTVPYPILGRIGIGVTFLRQGLGCRIKSLRNPFKVKNIKAWTFLIYHLERGGQMQSCPSRRKIHGRRAKQNL